jgi:hypothetical protein
MDQSNLAGLEGLEGLPGLELHLHLEDRMDQSNLAGLEGLVVQEDLAFLELLADL